jgi:hypothetical protein
MQQEVVGKYGQWNLGFTSRNPLVIEHVGAGFSPRSVSNYVFLNVCEGGLKPAPTLNPSESLNVREKCGL